MRFFICLSISVVFDHFNIEYNTLNSIAFIVWSCIAGIQDIRELLKKSI